MQISEFLAEYVVNTNYEDLPQDMIDLCKKDLLDTFAVSVAAVGEPGGKELVNIAKALGGSPDCTVIGYGFKTNAPLASMINSTTAHSLDYDDVMFSTGHVGVTCIPPAIAAAELKGNVSGKELITAIVLGIDVMCRLGEASKPLAMGPGWLYTPLYGVFGATAAAGKILGLSSKQLKDAFGIAYSQAAGTRQPVTEGAVVKRIQAGFASKAGLMSVLAAREGVTGPAGCFDGKFGLVNCYHRGDFNPQMIERDIKKYFALSEITFKKYPACSATEASAEAGVELACKYNLEYSDIKNVTVHVGQYSKNCAEPLEKKQHPATDAEGQFSIPWVVATALVKKKFTIADVGPEELKNKDIVDLAAKIDVVIDLPTSQTLASFPARVEVETLSGKQLSVQIDFATGHKTRPMSLEDIKEKFVLCCASSKKKFSDDAVNDIIEKTLSIENVDDISTVIEKLA